MLASQVKRSREDPDNSDINSSYPQQRLTEAESQLVATMIALEGEQNEVTRLKAHAERLESEYSEQKSDGNDKLVTEILDSNAKFCDRITDFAALLVDALDGDNSKFTCVSYKRGKPQGNSAVCQVPQWPTYSQVLSSALNNATPQRPASNQCMAPPQPSTSRHAPTSRQSQASPSPPRHVSSRRHVSPRHHTRPRRRASPRRHVTPRRHISAWRHASPLCHHMRQIQTTPHRRIIGQVNLYPLFSQGLAALSQTKLQPVMPTTGTSFVAIWRRTTIRHRTIAQWQGPGQSSSGRRWLKD